MPVDVSKLEDCDPRRAVIQILDEADTELASCERKLDIVIDYLDQRAKLYKRLAELDGDL